MNARQLTSSVFAFCLGACATAAVQSNASEAPATNATAVITKMADAEVRTAPPGTATITHLARGQNAYVGKLSMNAGGKVPKHRDATEEYIHILEGSGTIHIDGVATEIGAGDTVYMPANAEVHYENGDSQLVAIQVFAGPAPSAKYEKWKK